jgi:hypothetical protein
LTLLGGSLSLNTTGNTGLVADIGADGLGSGASGGHVSIDVGKDVDATVLVDQVNVADGSHALNRHLLELVDNILERTAGSEGGVGTNDVGVGTIGSIDDSLVVQLVNLSVEGNGGGLLELNVVLDAGTGVEEV